MTSERRAEGRVALATVLVVDDAVAERKLLRAALEDEGFAVVEATDAHHALDAARHESPDVIIVAANLGSPPNDSLDAAALLRTTERLSDTPLLMPAPSSDPHTVARSVREEAIKGAVRRDLLESWHASLSEAAASLDRPIESSEPLTVFVIGVDDFHHINYEHGQLVGLAVLRIAARRLGSVLEGDAVIGRRGSEDFVVLRPGSDPDEARKVAADLRAVVGRAPFSFGKDWSLHVTVSVGVLSTTMGSVDDAVIQATASLRAAQRQGRDRMSFG
jgi:diguanylate cyclase (GGDEF)-like protein